MNSCLIYLLWVLVLVFHNTHLDGSPSCPFGCLPSVHLGFGLLGLYLVGMCILCHFGSGFLFRLQLAMPLYVAIATSDGTSDDKVGIGKTLSFRRTNGGTLFSWMNSTTVHWTRATMCNIIYIDYHSMVYNKKSLCLFRLQKYVIEWPLV